MDLTVEADIVEAQFIGLFIEHEIDLARRRLEQFGYAVKSASMLSFHPPARHRSANLVCPLHTVRPSAGLAHVDEGTGGHSGEMCRSALVAQ
jgi:hypothetical protein